MFYTNRSTATKTFHGVTFGPGETKEVFGIINDPQFIPSSTRQEPPKCDRSTKPESHSVDVKPLESVSADKAVKKKLQKQITSTSHVESNVVTSSEEKLSINPDSGKEEISENKEV